MFYSAHTLNLDTKEWTKTDFEKRKDALSYIKSQFKYPGEYNLKYTEGYWNEQAHIFQRNQREKNNGHYPIYAKGSIDFRKHWDFEKEKCEFEGFIIYKKPSENLEFAVPCLYYWYLNYCPIPDKVKQRDDFPQVYDGDYHYYLYILQCVLRRKYGVVLKKRQCLLPDSVINTPSGSMRIDDMQSLGYKGDVYTYCPETGEIIVDEILDVVKAKKVKKYIRIQTYGGRYIECSLDHKIFIKNHGWKEAKNITVKDEIVELINDFGNTSISDDEAKVVGYFLTDGSYPVKKYAPKFTNITKEFLDEFESSLLKFSPESSITKSVKGKGFDYVIVSSDKSKQTENKFKSWLYEQGFCAKGKDRAMPLKYTQLDKKSTSVMLNRMFAAHGWIHKIKGTETSVRYEIGIASMSIVFIQQIQTLLYKYGIASYMNKENDDFFKLRISGSRFVDIFLSEIGIYKKDVGLSKTSISVVKKNVNLNSVSKIKIIKKSVQLYDIVTKEHNSFFANGIYVHNSGYSLKNMSIKLNVIWFIKSAMTKIFAKDISKVEESWSFMSKYRDHINNHCGWTRGFDKSNKVLDWQTGIKQTDGSVNAVWGDAKGFTTKQDSTNGIGGAAKLIFAEESGANDTLDQTHEFITSNVSYGGLVTGLIIYSGAVGKLEQAEPLKKFMINPESEGFLSCINNIEDDKEFGDKVGFFAPEWWNYVSVEEDEEGEPVGEAKYCFDEWGNTDKELALKEIAKWRKIAKQKSPEKYRFYCSQRPLSIKEAFAFRKEMVFPANLVLNQERRIEDGMYPYECVDIVPNKNNDLEIVKSDKRPILDFPIKENAVDKEGVICMFERPFCYPARPDFGTYYTGSIDPVSEGKTISSDSLFSVIIHKHDVEVTRTNNDIIENFIEHGKIVCTWTGRFDDINKTNTRAQYILEIYGARAVVENNVTSFITHMIHKKKQYYIIPKKELVFLKDMGANENVFQEYGWRNTGTMFSSNLLNYGVEYTKEIIDQETAADGKIIKEIFGIQRIPDIMIIKEMKAYFRGLNVDRLVAYCALVAHLKIRLANMGYVKRIETNGDKKVDPNLYAKPSTFFKNIASTSGNTNSDYNIKRSGFRNLK